MALNHSGFVIDLALAITLVLMFRAILKEAKREGWGPKPGEWD